ncbi:MAG: NAD(P)-dependent oxidoreductase [Oxalobacteraceae bacterium]|nr:MAG: NAD(P)-dependent oxidoreductase [Oxalobacteraceae bacterium]
MTQEKAKLKVLVTGAAGRIGSAFVRIHLQDYDLRLADRDVSRLEKHSRDVVQLDITDLAACMQACAGIDTVIHLAAEVSPDISDFMTTLLPTNIVGTYNIFQAALAQGCRRVVFASSAQAIEGYPQDVQVSETMPVRPKNLYGVTKVFGEALGSYIADTSDLSIIAVRIANVAHFSRGEQHSPRDVAAYISVRDVVHLLMVSVQSNVTGFTIVNGVSDNRYKRLSIERSRQLLGYHPKDDSFSILAGESDDAGDEMA